MEFRILGPLEVRREGETLPLGPQKQKVLLCLLLLKANEVVPAGRLIDELWGERPPRTAAHALQVHVTRLRKLLEPGRARRILHWRGGGYVLEFEPDALDARRCERLLEEARRSRRVGEPATARRLLSEALALWRGPPLADLAYEPFAQTEIARLEELGLALLEERIEADLALGRHRDRLGELQALVAKHPLRERLREQLMLALYHSGRQAEALAAYRDARRTLVDELGIEPGAALKTLHERILAQDPALEPPVEPPVTTGPGNLPAPPTLLIGREREVAECCELLRRDDIRLLVLTGAGGIGKTRLGVAVARALAREFDDGAWYVALAHLTDPELVATTIARALGLKETDEPVPATLRRYVRDRELLLVLDNFEHLLPAAPLLAELLEAGPALKLLATSRALLRLAAEHRYPVEPLELPDAMRLPDLRTLAGSPAIALFLDRARALTPGYALTDENARAVAEICVRLDGLPLALELAAARVRLLGARALRDRLEQRLPLLTGGAREAPARQRTLRATLDWSFGLLDGAEQRLFARLACFAGGCSLEAAEAVCGATLNELGSLVDKSLLRERERPRGEPRFVMLAVLREYALERLEASGEGPWLRRRHAHHYVTLAERAEPEILGADQAVWLERLEADHDNFRAALGWALDRGEIELALRLSGSLRRAWTARGYLTETRGWLEAALERAHGAAPSARAKALYGLGRVALAQGDYREAMPHLEESAALSRAVGDVEDLVFALADAGWIAAARGERERATRLAEEALTEARRAGNNMAIAAALHSLGCAALGRGDHRRAQTFFEESLALRRARDDKRNIANSLVHLGETALLDGDYGRAREVLKEALSLGRELENLLLVSAALANLALVALFEANIGRAASLAADAVAACRELGDKRTAVECLHVLAGVAAARRQPLRAATLAGAAEAIHDSIDAPPSRAERAVGERFLAASREEAGAARFDAARQHGRTFELEGAIAFALTQPSPGEAEELALGVHDPPAHDRQV